MELTLSTHLLVYRKLDRNALEALAAAGFATLEVWLAEPHVPWRSGGGLAIFRQKLQDFGLRVGTVHLPFYPSVPDLLDRGRRWSLLDPGSSARQEALEGSRQGLQAAAALGAGAAVLHLGWQGDVWKPTHYHLAEEAVAELLAEARRQKVQLLLENIISEGTRSHRLVALLDRLDPTGEAGLCLDLGHAHVEGQVRRELDAALPRLRHLHVHDNHGQQDSHLAPGEGSLPWAEVLERLRQVGFSGQAALEIRDPSRGALEMGHLLDQQLRLVDGFRHQFGL
ncbi:MAG: sugar phosphate isomerase/epimerase [Planctomycetota bacterium]|nr:MAG: sugar phosphate isomerase/epimerase [Planctomycetota bacterium]